MTVLSYVLAVANVADVVAYPAKAIISENIYTTPTHADKEG